MPTPVHGNYQNLKTRMISGQILFFRWVSHIAGRRSASDLASCLADLLKTYSWPLSKENGQCLITRLIPGQGFRWVSQNLLAVFLRDFLAEFLKTKAPFCWGLPLWTGQGGWERLLSHPSPFFGGRLLPETNLLAIGDQGMQDWPIGDEGHGLTEHHFEKYCRPINLRRSILVPKGGKESILQVLDRYLSVSDQPNEDCIVYREVCIILFVSTEFSEGLS
jgi:hypothetical protein